ncbi:DUF924 family protein [Pseudoxanthomonas suwonensis]
MATAREVVEFWRQAGADAWFAGDAAFDRECARLEQAHMEAARGGHEDWLQSSEGALALMVLLDQIPRNIYRGTGHAFATDGLARRYALRAIEAGHDQAVEPALRAFFYLPLEHAEDMGDQDYSVELFTALGDRTYLDYAIAHRDVIARFGRFPHRNQALGRVSTAEEQAWLDAGGGF